MALRHLFKTRPTTVYVFRYERADGHFREINVPVGLGRFKRGSQQDALELAERRLSEQFGDLAFQLEESRRVFNPDHVDPGANLLRQTPELHQDYYKLVSVTKE